MPRAQISCKKHVPLLYWGTVDTLYDPRYQTNCNTQQIFCFVLFRFITVRFCDCVFSFLSFKVSSSHWSCWSSVCVCVCGRLRNSPPQKVSGGRPLVKFSTLWCWKAPFEFQQAVWSKTTIRTTHHHQELHTRPWKVCKWLWLLLPTHSPWGRCPAIHSPWILLWSSPAYLERDITRQAVMKCNYTEQRHGL